MADNHIADVILKSDGVIFQPRVEAVSFILTVTSPCGIVISKNYDGRDTPMFALEELQVENVDGSYTYELRMRPVLSGAEKELLADLRKNGTKNDIARLRTDGLLFKEIPPQSGDFVVFKGAITTNTGLPESEKRSVVEDTGAGLFSSADLATSGGLQNMPAADFVILDDLIVDGSACIGFDCVNGESFGFDTIRLKENNLRIKFDDTSVAASFPRNDWQLTANDSANGGASKFSIDDISGNRTPFTVEANARSHSLYVDDGGRIGSRTSTPSTEIHTIDGDTPTLRLQQDGSSGFAPQTWDVAGNETNFFIRDVTNGSTLPFRIRPGAPTSSIFIDVDGDVGIGTSSPDETFHVFSSDGDGKLLVEETNGTASTRTMLSLLNNGGVRMNINDNWTITATGGNLSFDSPASAGGGAGNEAQMQPDGDFAITGDFISNGTTLNVPDYVFEPDYALMPIDELKDFIVANKHLPNVPNAAQTHEEGLNLTTLQLRLLEKIEELTLYTVQQHDQIGTLVEENSQLLDRLQRLEAALGVQ